MHVPKLLWCYDDKPKFQKTKKQQKQQENSNFMEQQQIRYINYRDSDQVLGQTYSVLILQDFQSLTPNTLAKCVETVRGGGMIILLITSVQNLKDLSEAKMDVHKRYITKSQMFNSSQCVNRFTERFLKILETCDRFLALDQSLDVLEISDHIKEMKNMIGIKNYQVTNSVDKEELLALRQQAIDSGDPIKSTLSKVACTVDQCQILINLLDVFQVQKQGVIVNAKEFSESNSPVTSDSEDVIQQTKKLSKDEKAFDKKLNKLQKHNKKGYNQLMNELNLNKQPILQEQTTNAFPSQKTIFIKAARGRGKSALIGLSLGAAISQQATNILVFAPNASNVQTLFEFAIKSIAALGYQEHVDYKTQKTSSLELAEIVGIDIFKTHKQTIRYIDPENVAMGGNGILSLADLIIVDEAAAMPVDVMNEILKAESFVIVSSTVHGYEGSGRALTLKVLQNVQQRKSKGFQLIQYDLTTPIRYNSGDRIEQWLYDLLLLDCEKSLDNHLKSQKPSFAPVEQTTLFQLSRDTLFSGEAQSENYLKLIWSIFVTSHYKNQPNDIQLLSDSPSSRLFVLLAPITDPTQLPLPICVIHASIEGDLPLIAVEKSLNKQLREDGNMVPWLLSQQFQQPSLSSKTTIRIVRIATNPFFMQRGYGQQAVQQLQKLYSNQISISKLSERVDRDMQNHKIGSSLPPLLLKLDQVSVEKIDYLSVAFGLSSSLFIFYRKLNFLPFYLKASKSHETGENSILMINNFNQIQIFTPLNLDFTKRFFRLSSNLFKEIPCDLCFRIISSCNFEKQQFDFSRLSGTDFSRIQAFVERKIEFNAIFDLSDELAQQVFLNGNSEILTTVQQRIFCAICIQKKTFLSVSKEISLPRDQIQAIFCKAIEGVYNELRKAEDVGVSGDKVKTDEM
eukprot:EST48445.1 N-acetyltransferase-like protein [Spironucleus salmonicida]